MRDLSDVGSLALATALAAALITGTSEAAAQATLTVNLAAQADSHVRSDLDGRRNDNYGRQQVLMLGTSRGATGLPYGAADAARILLRFDLDGLPPSPLISADLVLRIQQFGSGSASSLFTVQAHRIVPSGARTPWVEGNGFEGWPTNAPAGSTDVDNAFGVAWAGAGDNGDPSAANNTTQPDFDAVSAAAAVIPRASTPAGTLVRWNLTDLVSRWRSGELPNLGVVLRDPTTAGDFREIYFDARDGAALPVPSPNWTTVPQLQLVFQAEPASKANCKEGGWTRFPLRGFRNQGDCVSWLVTR